MHDDVLKRYLDDIRKTSPLTREEEQFLFLLVKQGHMGARERLVSANLRFVLKVALRYRTRNLPLQDLVSEGSMGLLRAVESFDPSRGLKFISYAVWWIKAYITRALQEQGGLIRLPANQHLRVKKAMRESSIDGEVDEELRRLMQISEGCVSIDEPMGDDDGKALGDMVADFRTLSPDAEVEVSLVEGVTQDILESLPSREAEVIKGLYGMDNGSPLNLREVGEALQISHERVRQLRDQALKRIRRSIHRLQLRDRLDGYQSACGTITAMGK